MKKGIRNVEREKTRIENMKIDANGTEIRVMGDVVNEDAYISLTDIAKYKKSRQCFYRGSKLDA